MIVITTTATRRPEILARTFESFRQYLFTDAVLEKIPVELIINVDPVGQGTLRDMISVARAHFQVITLRDPEAPSFPAAFKWAWYQAAEHVTARYVFHLEDDWELQRPIDLEAMIGLMEEFSGLALLRLPAFAAGPEVMKNWNLQFPWCGKFYECPKDLRIAAGFCGHPSLIKIEFVRNAAWFLSPEKNPEKQFHCGPRLLLDEVSKWRYGVYARPGDPPAIQDIGRKWMIENNLCKAGSKAFFTHWEEANA